MALVGDRFDAHDFLAAAAEAGATGAVVERVPEGAPADMRYFVVETPSTRWGGSETTAGANSPPAWSGW